MIEVRVPDVLVWLLSLCTTEALTTLHPYAVEVLHSVIATDRKAMWGSSTRRHLSGTALETVLLVHCPGMYDVRDGVLEHGMMPYNSHDGAIHPEYGLSDERENKLPRVCA
jgi:hypothetical protein